MFVNACMTNRYAIYGLLASSPLKPQGITASNGSAFMVAPGFLITAAHCVHQDTNHKKPIHAKLELIRVPDIGQRMEIAKLHAIDDALDLAVLRIDDPRSKACLLLLDRAVPRGTSVGSLGFPLGQVLFTPQGMAFNVVERFQSASLSAFVSATRPDGSLDQYYETDSLMYGGSSGCPGFLATGEVWGMQNRSLMQTPKTKTRTVAAPDSTRLAVSLWVPSTVILGFAMQHQVPL